ncbi:unnamed protein product [Arctia plantaginis]|uniref:Peptidase M14 domain-containing protein n=1 Tax=Arctia plantaginis TaxID=874455 RepID=A0A8S1ASP4_ARCPL|nr:unnamed protein product [Arctia plantaginis]
MLIRLISLIFLFTLVFSEKNRFDNYTLYKVVPKNGKQVEYLADLKETFKEYDFWDEILLSQYVNILSKPDMKSDLENFLSGAGIDFEITLENIQEFIDKETKKHYTRNDIRSMQWDSYYTLEDINTWLDDMVLAHPDTASIIIGGRSHEGRDIKGIRISHGAGKRAVFIESGIHAREWISPATTNFIINELLTSDDEEVKAVARDYDWYIFPVTNPDGYVWTHVGYRLWRKNRAPYGNDIGVDLNRNWNSNWLGPGTSSNSSSNNFAGRGPFSEVETRTLSEYITNMADRIDLYLSFHSAGQLLLLPYGNTTEPLDNYHDAMKIGRRAMGALSVRYGTQYTTGNIAEAIYLATGGSIDWVKEYLRVPLVYCYELRDRGVYGHLLPPEQILPTSEEVMDSLVEMIFQAKRFGYMNAGNAIKIPTLLIVGFILILPNVFSEKIRYDDYTLYKIQPKSLNHIKLLQDLQVNDARYDFWNSPVPSATYVNILSSPANKAELENFVKSNNMDFEIVTSNIQEAIDKEVVSTYTRNAAGNMTWDRYYDLDSVYSWIDDLAALFPQVATIVIGGRTHEGREIKGLRISHGSGRKAIFVEGGLHAREWISIATVNFIANELLTSDDAETRAAARDFDWYIFPITNPDGYDYSHRFNRMWRKNRRPIGQHFGVDLNRNWNSNWLVAGASVNPASDIFAGLGPFSEIETRTLSTYINSIGDRLELYLSFHSFGQMLLLPFGNTTEPLDNYYDALNIGRRAMGALSVRFGTRYVTGNIAEVIYHATGGTIDWVKEFVGVPLVYCYELRENNTYGFLLPAEQILPNNLEVMDSILEMIHQARRFGYMNNANGVYGSILLIAFITITRLIY